MKKIIIAEDDPGIQDAAQLILERAGYEVTAYMIGSSLLENNFILPDLFLLDFQMPGTNGLDVCRHLKQQEQTKHIPIIMLSATPGIRAIAQDAGADDALEKPFKMKMLLELVRKYLTDGRTGR